MASYGGAVSGFLQGLQGGLAMQDQLSSMQQRMYQNQYYGARTRQQEAETAEFVDPAAREARLKTLQGNANLALEQARNTRVQADTSEAELHEYQDPGVTQSRRGNLQAIADNNRALANQRQLEAQKSQVDLIEYTTPAAAERRRQTEELLQQGRYDAALTSAAAVNDTLRKTWEYYRDYAQVQIEDKENAGEEVPAHLRHIAESGPPNYLSDVQDRIALVQGGGSPSQGQAVPASRPTVSGDMGARLSNVMALVQQPATVVDPFTGKQVSVPALSPVQAAVWAGNVQQESGGNPNSLNHKEGAFGQIQWTSNGRRKENLFAFAKANGMAANDPRAQSLFGRWELVNTERTAGQRFLAAQTPQEANAALKSYIRYGDESQGTRLSNAMGLMGQPAVASSDAGTTGQPPPPAPGSAAAPYQAVPVQQAPANSLDQDREEMNQIGARAHAEILQPDGAVPTQEDQQRQLAHFQGEGAPDPNAWQQLQEMTRAMDPADMPEDQRQLLHSLAVYRNVKRNYPGDAEKQKAIASELQQRAQLEASKWLAITRVAAQRGDVKGALDTLLRAAAHVPNGIQATYKKQEDGDYEVQFARRNGEVVHKVIAPPEKILGFALGVGPKEAYQALYTITGTTPPGGSPEYQQAQQGILSTMTPPNMQVPNAGAMTAEETKGLVGEMGPFQVKGASPEQLTETRDNVQTAWDDLVGGSLFGGGGTALTGLTEDNQRMIANNENLIKGAAENLAHASSLPPMQAMRAVLSMVSVDAAHPKDLLYEPMDVDANGNVRIQDKVNGYIFKMPAGDFNHLMQQRQAVEGFAQSDLDLAARH